MKIIIKKYGITLLGKVLFISFLLAGNTLRAQDFALSVTTTDETCPGNGAMQFSVQNAGASVNYKVYLLPNTTTPISNNSTPSLSGLGDGTYLVVATTTVDGNQVTDEQEATIDDNTTPLVFADEWPNTPSFCDDGIFTVEMESGSPILYQITAGPETAPAQASATFTGLPAGLYTIKATDGCGTAVVTTYVLGTMAPDLVVTMGGIAPQLPDCEHITILGSVVNIDAANTDITYPLTAQITMYPPDGSTPQVFTTDVYGMADLAQIAVTIPLYYAQEYYYDLLLTDTCGTQFTVNNNSLLPMFGIAATTNDLECDNKALLMVPTIFVPPVNINFTSVPDGFDPTLNPSYPDFFGNALFGTNEAPLIEGEYHYTATDACGRSVTSMFEYIAPPPIVPEVSGSNIDCENNLGKIEGTIPSRDIVKAIITSAPPEFIALFGPLPYDASAYIEEYPDDDDKLKFTGLPPGDYIIVFTDQCDEEYDPFTINVPVYNATQKVPRGRPDCEVGMATVNIGTGVVSVIMTVVPEGSPITAPFNCAQYINVEDGNFSLDNLVPGTYTFEISDACQTYTKTINLAGYATTLNDINMTPHCGSFDISLFHTTNGIAGLSFWLQREITPGNWGHPGTAAPFTDTYNNTTAVLLTNNSINYTLIYPQGNYRIVKTWRAFESGDINVDKTCEELLFEFEYIDGVDILGVQSLTCTGVSGDVQVNAVGVEPLTYTIVAKNGDPYTINNGNNNAFLGLDSASYTVEVGDPCGNTSVLSFNIAEVPSLVNAYPAPNMVLCDIGSDGVEEFMLSDQDTYILNGQDTTNITLTYHPSYADADAGTNPLPIAYTTGPCTVYARVEYNGAMVCHDITIFDIILNYSAEMVMQDMYYVCDGTELELIADPGYVSYLWSNGAQTQSILVTEAGQFSVTAISSQGCISSKTVDVYTTALPAISTVTVQDWTEVDNVITVEVEASDASVQNFEYSINGIYWQDSNVFTGLEPGRYTVYVRDIYGCDWVSEKVYLLTYPRFFTPNGDGINETWRIQFASLAEPDLMVYIYDRYGKLITGFDANSLGWDGTLNSSNLPATDYWFVVKRQNGKEYRGHFSLLR